jgi:hypothetical protein
MKAFTATLRGRLVLIAIAVVLAVGTLASQGRPGRPLADFSDKVVEVETVEITFLHAPRKLWVIETNYKAVITSRSEIADALSRSRPEAVMVEELSSFGPDEIRVLCAGDTCYVTELREPTMLDRLKWTLKGMTGRR